MNYRELYEKYKNRYLKLKSKIYQDGGSLQSDLDRNIKNMSIDELLKIGPVKQYIIDEILSTKKLDNNEFDNIVFENSLGEGHFGKTYKIILGDNRIAIAKVMPNAEINKKYLEAEIVSHSLINKSNCNLPKIYGYFENVNYNGQNVNIIIAEFIKGNNLLKELSSNDFNILNSEHFYFINVWINRLENTVKCLHNNGIVHRDIKVDNVMIKYDINNNATRNAILIDYGLSCRYIAFCIPEMYVPITSPLKIINQKNKTESIDIEKMNDCYSLGILILDVLSLVIDKELFHTGVSKEINIRKLEFDKLMENINRFINRILDKYPIVKILTDKAYRYIKFGLSQKEMNVLESGIIDIEPTLKYDKNEYIDVYDGYLDGYKDEYLDVSKYI